MRKIGSFSNTCGRCGGKKDDHRIGKYSYCNKCHAKYMREHRPKHNELSELARKKANARAYAHVYRDRGKIKKENCIVCGSENSQMHHEDYNKPIQVKWMCRKCHLSLHNGTSNHKQ